MPLTTTFVRRIRDFFARLDRRVAIVVFLLVGWMIIFVGVFVTLVADAIGHVERGRQLSPVTRLAIGVAVFFAVGLLGGASRSPTASVGSPGMSQVPTTPATSSGGPVAPSLPTPVATVPPTVLPATHPPTPTVPAATPSPEAPTASPEAPTPSPALPLLEVRVRYTTDAFVGGPIVVRVRVENRGDAPAEPLRFWFQGVKDYADIVGCDPSCETGEFLGSLYAQFSDRVVEGETTTYEVELLATDVGVMRWSLGIHTDTEDVFFGEGTTVIR